MGGPGDAAQPPGGARRPLPNGPASHRDRYTNQPGFLAPGPALVGKELSLASSDAGAYGKQLPLVSSDTGAYGKQLPLVSSDPRLAGKEPVREPTVRTGSLQVSIAGPRS